MNRFYKFLARLNKPIFDVKPEHRIIPAFMSGGVQYYRFEKALEIPYERALWASAYYTELESKCSREYLLKFSKAMDASLNDKRIRYTDLAILNNQLKERLDFVVEPDLMWKIASVEFFDASENPYKYNQTHGLKKIAAWKKYEDIEAFFLRMPIGDLIPYLQQSGVDTPTFFQTMEKVNVQHLQVLSSLISKSSSTIRSEKKST